MAIYQTNEPFGDTFPSVVARTEGLRAAQSIDIDVSLYPTQKIFPPGIFAGTHTVPNKYRLLPRTRFVSNAGAVITVSPYTAALFVTGDVITQINLADGTAGTAAGTVVSVNHAANTITLNATPGAIPAAGTVIGVATSRPVMANGNRLGIISPNTAIDMMTIRPNSHFAAFQGGTFYRSFLPHLDTELERLYPQHDFV